jgi:hypothetical protein
MLSKPTAKILFFLLLVVSVLFTLLGGYMDMMNQPRWGMMSKEHFWNDGLFLLGVCGLLLYVLYE